MHSPVVYRMKILALLTLLVCCASCAQTNTRRLLAHKHIQDLPVQVLGTICSYDSLLQLSLAATNKYLTETLFRGPVCYEAYEWANILEMPELKNLPCHPDLKILHVLKSPKSVLDKAENLAYLTSMVGSLKHSELLKPFLLAVSLEFHRALLQHLDVIEYNFVHFQEFLVSKPHDLLAKEGFIMQAIEMREALQAIRCRIVASRPESARNPPDVTFKLPLPDLVLDALSENPALIDRVFSFITFGDMIEILRSRIDTRVIVSIFLKQDRIALTVRQIIEACSEIESYRLLNDRVASLLRQIYRYIVDNFSDVPEDLTSALELRGILPINPVKSYPPSLIKTAFFGKQYHILVNMLPRASNIDLKLSLLLETDDLFRRYLIDNRNNEDLLNLHRPNSLTGNFQAQTFSFNVRGRVRDCLEGFLIFKGANSLLEYIQTCPVADLQSTSKFLCKNGTVQEYEVYLARQDENMINLQLSHLLDSENPNLAQILNLFAIRNHQNAANPGLYPVFIKKCEVYFMILENDILCNRFETRVLQVNFKVNGERLAEMLQREEFFQALQANRQTFIRHLGLFFRNCETRIYSPLEYNRLLTLVKDDFDSLKVNTFIGKIFGLNITYNDAKNGYLDYLRTKSSRLRKNAPSFVAPPNLSNEIPEIEYGPDPNLEKDPFSD